MFPTLIQNMNGTLDIKMPDEEKKFRFQNQRALLTYKEHLPKDQYIEWLTAKTGIKPTFIRLAHENGQDDPNTPYKHTHVVVDFGKIFQTTNPRYFDFCDIHPHIKTLKSKKAMEDAKVYIAKEDIENEDLKHKSIYTLVGQCKTIGEALEKYVENPSDALGIVTLYNMREQETVRQTYTPNQQWQLELIEEVKGKPDFRKIIWYVDEVGNSGKTALARYLTIEDSRSWLISKDAGTSRDFATIIASAISNGWNHHGFILDLPRQCRDHSRMYQYIEEAKDGFVTAQKYQGKTIVFNQPHVIVFSNWWPSISNLSLDRWDVREIMKDKSCRHVPINEMKDRCGIPDCLVLV